MRIQPTREGLWLTLRPGSSNLYPWHSMLLPVLTPVLVAFFLLILVARRSELPEVFAGWEDDPGAALSQGGEVVIDHLRVGLENLLATELASETSRLPTLRLQLDKNAMGDMQRALRTGNPQLGHQDGGNKPYFPGNYLDETGQLQDCNVSLRGLSPWHHHPEKPSLRVRIKRNDITRGRRFVELQRPEDVLALRNWIPVKLARGMGLVTELIDHVRVFVNDRYMGVYLRTVRAGEPMALENGRMPGTFFKGDAVGTKLGKDLWTDIDAWDTFATEEEEVEIVDPRARAAMLDFLAVLRRRPSIDTLGQLASSLDLEAYAKWSALMIVTGSLHTDNHHNHMYFWCSNQGLFEPVPWDTNSFGTHAAPIAPVNVVLNPVMDMAIRDPRWVHRRNQIIRDLIEGSASREALHRLIDTEVDRMLADLKADGNLSSLELVRGKWGLAPASVLEIDDYRASFKKWVDERLQFVTTFFADARVTVEPDPGRPGWSRVSVFGNVAIRAERRDGATLTGLDGRDARVLLPGLAAELEPAMHKVAVPYPKPAPLVYSVEASPQELLFFNAITEQPVAAGNGAPQATTARSIHPWDFPTEPTDQVILGPGDITLNEDLHIGAQQQLTIRAGTTIRLAAGVGIYSRGLTRVEGRADAKVVLEPATRQPWGAFAVAGPGTAGSSFRHMQVRGGSEASDGHALYKGMFSVYNCPDVTIAHCWFGANASGDDAVNLAESHINVENCQFQGAPSDALDTDMCTGRIAFCDFEGSGNDGLDMMTCQLLVENCTFTSCGDKGISIGERSQVVVRSSDIVRCQIGIEAKDDSMVLIQNSSLWDNVIAFHAYQKKWIYNRGGRGLLLDCEIRGSTQAHASLESRARLDLVRTPIRVPDDPGNRIRRYEDIPERWLDLWETWR